MHIVQVLKAHGYQVDEYVFDLVPPPDALVDGLVLSRSFDVHDADGRTKVFEDDCTIFEQVMQVDADQYIQNNNFKNARFQFGSGYDRKTIQNAFRQLYSEYMVASFLRRHATRYAAAVVISSDVLITDSISIHDVREAELNPSIAFTSYNNDGSGYTDGFYLGHLDALVPIMERLEYLFNNETVICNKERHMRGTPKCRIGRNKREGRIGDDYEYVLKQAFILNGIKRRVLHGFSKRWKAFGKLRNTGNVVIYRRHRFWVPTDVKACIDRNF
eukprot:gene18061-21512_t